MQIYEREHTDTRIMRVCRLNQVTRLRKRDREKEKEKNKRNNDKCGQQRSLYKSMTYEMMSREEEKNY